MKGITTANPHFNIIAIEPPAKPIIEPTERSNSPAIINIPAASATIPNWAITLKLFLIPKALNPSPEKGFRENSPYGIEKYPNIKKSKIITPKGPTSGRAINAEYHFFSPCRSDSCLGLFVVDVFIFKKGF